MATYEFSYTVNGRGRFPMDMLRYDHSTPYSSADAARIEATFDSPMGVPIGITLVKVTNDKDWKPCVDRWASFLWGCSPANRLKL